MAACAALLPNKSRWLNPVCSDSSSARLRAGLRAISSAVSTVVLAGRRRTSSGKRVASTITGSFCAKELVIHRPASTPVNARSIEASLASSPTPQRLRKTSRPVSGLTSKGTREIHLPNPKDARLPTRTARSGLVGHPHSLTVAGAVQAFHLFPEHPKASRYHSRMRWVALFLWFVSSHPALSQPVVRDDYGNEVRLAAPAVRIVGLAPHLT